ncbi:hypothetical protein [Anaeromyxobacter diazotrophicus]|uniref:Uncharacterized protein n=1 Tax=Anaeromyxobacter diazotrophicus TaxID=2590199 RepID=A0A7I9VIW5_9BACT|nr:hypothetical protein [Anaeromyxobacter diazotrophicus]GEJ56129.1 hypothetical protein AMYX_08700 [Anaeromyxobacter diazotrophicus]
MPLLDEQKRRALEFQARDPCEAMAQSTEGQVYTGLDFSAAYVAAKALVDGLRRGVSADLVEELDDAAAEFTAERLAEIGLSKDGAN